MEDNYGISKAALGVRYLLKYIETGNQEYFNIVMDCINEVELWCLITSYCNNIDELFDIVPDFVLDNIFTTRVPEDLTFGEAFGKGFKSNSNLKSKEQFLKIRALLSHGRFKYAKGIITVFYRDYEATFDIKWLERLTSVTLGNERLGLEKGMSDISIMSLVHGSILTTRELKEYIEKGLIQFYKVTSLTGNKESIVSAMPYKVISSEELTFETIFQTAISIMKTNTLNIFDTLEENKRQLNKYYREIEECFGNKIKVENTPIKVSEDLLYDEGFQDLNLEEKLKYLIRIAKLDNPVRYNGEILKNLLELFKGFKEGNVHNLNIFALRDAKNFLLKVYANIFFTGSCNRDIDNLVSDYPLTVRYVHAKTIYKEYLKVLNRSYNELEKYNGSTFSKKYIYELLGHYSKLLEEAIKDNPYKDFAWKMRNSLVHNQVEFKEGFVRFYNTGRNIKINHFSKKSKTWELKEFSNSRVIWEMSCSIQELLNFLDELFTKNDIEIQVTISEYTRRKDYLRNIK